MVAAQGGLSAQRESIAQARVRQIRSFVASHLDTDIALIDAANHCGISVRYICRLLRDDGTSFAELLWKSRLEKATAWLISSEMDGYNIAEIASMAGYKTLPHFSRAFKRKIGLTPTKLRKMTYADRMRVTNQFII